MRKTEMKKKQNKPDSFLNLSLTVESTMPERESRLTHDKHFL